MIQSVKNMLTAYHMVSEGDHVICAVSGGRDSVALLHCMAALAETLHITISAAHFNHCLRGAEADRDEAFVQSLCGQLQLPLVCGSEDVQAYAASHHLGTEDAARTLRYRFLLSIDPAARIATAHNADDNLETMLLHLIRGCGLHGLGGIPPVRGNIIRPLLTCDRSAINAYLEENQLTFVEDSTNSGDAYLRNRIRHHVIPVLRAENPAIATSASLLELTLRQEDALLDSIAERAFRTLSQQGRTLDIPGLLAQPEPLRNRILLKFLQDIPEVTGNHIAAALSLCLTGSPSASISLPGGTVLRRNYQLLTLAVPAITIPLQEQSVLFSGPMLWGDWKLEFRQCPYPGFLNTGELAIAYAPEHNYTIRPRQSGDRLKLPGGTRKISRLMIDQKIPLDHRNRYPVLCIDGNPAALLPLAVSVPCRPQTGAPCLIAAATKMEDIK